MERYYKVLFYSPPPPLTLPILFTRMFEVITLTSDVLWAGCYRCERGWRGTQVDIKVNLKWYHLPCMWDFFLQHYVLK